MPAHRLQAQPGPTTFLPSAEGGSVAPLSVYAEMPFSLTPNPRYLYVGTQHRSAIAKSLYLVEHRQGLTVIFGDVGMGKTTVGRHLLHHFVDYPEKFQVAYLPNPSFPSEHQLLVAICAEFGIAPARSKQATLARLNDFFIAQYQEGRLAVLLIDEAQLLKGSQFELLRQLLNFETDDHKLVQIVLFGQNELRAKLKPKKALCSRIVTRSTLEPLDLADTEGMIRFRLQVAGCAPDYFEGAAIARIYEASGGVPREVNKICLSAFTLATFAGLPGVDLALVNQAIKEIDA
ncbi:MAG: AAA family ATPase [Candidatus Sericytochromatia bacterium]|nr:AAA family ATPase [Candidatus Sericytochromatia bacterium]